MNKEYIFNIQEEIDFIRIDRYLNNQLKDYSRNFIHKLILNKNVLVNDNNISKNYILKKGDILKVFINKSFDALEIIEQNIDIDIFYEDEDILIVNKQKGMIVHPSNNIVTNTLVNAIMYHCKDKLSGINGVIRPGIVHRIDKNTSGLLVIAKNDNSHKFLSDQFKDHKVEREYHAIVYNNFKDQEGTIDKPIARSKIDRKKMAIVSDGRRAVTHYKLLENFNKFSYLKLNLETGRTHQIRVHMASINHPLAGDDVYGPKKVITSLNGQCLHAKTLGFIHPSTKKFVFFESDLPTYFNNFLNDLRGKQNE